MRNLDSMPNSLYLFGNLFVLANRVETRLERALLKYGVSSKQWFLSICVANLFENPPTLKELAKASGSSHQNVKQMALKLQEKQLMKLSKDLKDARVTRVSLSDQSPAFWAQTEEESQVFLANLYQNISEDDLTVVRRVYDQLAKNLDQMEAR